MRLACDRCDHEGGKLIAQFGAESMPPYLRHEHEIAKCERHQAGYARMIAFTRRAVSKRWRISRRRGNGGPYNFHSAITATICTKQTAAVRR